MTETQTTDPAAPQNPTLALFGIDATGPDDTFQGWHDPAERWNGFAVPVFPRHEVERIIQWVIRTGPTDAPPDRFEWDGTDLVHHEADHIDEPGYTPLRYRPIDLGSGEPVYAIGAAYWTWSVVEVTEAHLAGWTEQTKALILKAVEDGYVPDTVEDYSELHDYVDANDFTMHVPMWETDDTSRNVRDVAEVQDRIQAWIQAGGLRNR